MNSFEKYALCQTNENEVSASLAEHKDMKQGLTASLALTKSVHHRLSSKQINMLNFWHAH